MSAAFPHFGEEDCLRGWAGSGTIFFAFCNLRCVFCPEIDRRPSDREMQEAYRLFRKSGLSRLDERRRLGRLPLA